MPVKVSCLWHLNGAYNTYIYVYSLLLPKFGKHNDGIHSYYLQMIWTIMY
jgi:hypothetical protein